MHAFMTKFHAPENNACQNESNTGVAEREVYLNETAAASDLRCVSVACSFSDHFA